MINMNQVNRQQSLLENGFDLANDKAYAAWREQKIAIYPADPDEITVEIANPHRLTEEETTAIRKACSRANMAIYSIKSGKHTSVNAIEDKSIVADLGRHFCLEHLDSNLYADEESISSIQVSVERRQFEYIPYSNKAISWHTDGYYNPPERTIRAMVLHCVRPATRGGENALMDHEMLYMLLRDENPLYIEALMQPDVMKIPANVENGVEIRPEQTGPVFSVDPQSGCLHLRYTARTRSIEWKKDKATLSAVKYLEEILASDSPYIFHNRLSAGQGIICNNVLHTRSAFEDDEDYEGRLVYRARYYDRIK